jgi:hypothetical protein
MRRIMDHLDTETLRALDEVTRAIWAAAEKLGDS